MRAFREICLRAPLLEGVEKIERQFLACVSDRRKTVSFQGVEDLSGIEDGLRRLDTAVVKLTGTEQEIDLLGNPLVEHHIDVAGIVGHGSAVRRGFYDGIAALVDRGLERGLDLLVPGLVIEENNAVHAFFYLFDVVRGFLGDRSSFTQVGKGADRKNRFKV